MPKLFKIREILLWVADLKLIDKLAHAAPYIDLEITCVCGYGVTNRAQFEGEGSSHGMDQDYLETYAWVSEPVCEKCGLRLNAEVTLSAMPDGVLVYLSDLHTRGCKIKIIGKEAFYEKIGYKPAVPDSI